MSPSDRFPLLAGIDSPPALRTLDPEQLVQLAAELRSCLIETVARIGGHFAAGLGVVELTCALHHVFDTPHDRLIWDVGHQAYPHKILTGRRDRIRSIKQRGGLAAFPCRSESSYDAFGTGHAGTSISAALGMAIAAQQKHEKRQVVAVIGDGALTTGMAFEAINHAGGLDLPPDLLVILNDNRMSISDPVGGLARRLQGITGNARSSGNTLALFEDMGFHCEGPVDGHDFDQLLPALRRLRARPGLRMLHAVTVKGKGYSHAEHDQIHYHAVRPFDPARGLQPAPANRIPTWSQVFGRWLCDMAEADERLMGITPAMREGSGMVEFSRRFPARFFDVAIAEQHAVTFAAGLACEGLKPVVALYSTFMQRAWDQVIHDIALQNLDVLFAIDRAGLVGGDGATHAGSFDLAALRCLPGFMLMAPADENECRRMLTTGFLHPGPAAVRYPRGAARGVPVESGLEPLPVGKAELRRQGASLALLSFGALLPAAEIVAERLNLTLVNMRFIKPLDHELLQTLASEHEGLITLEDGCLAGGAGSAVAEWLAAQGHCKPLLQLGLPDRFLAQASRLEQLAECGLDAAGIEASIRARWPERFRATQDGDTPPPSTPPI